MTRDSRPPAKRRRVNSSQSRPYSNSDLPSTKTLGLTCSSCHRTVIGSLSCPRCGHATCIICSRTCTAAVHSPPPTPQLSWTPTPTSSPMHSPKKSILALTNTNLDSSNAKRKKPGEEEGMGGCGRVVCKDCCFESQQESSTTCYDCCGH
ncbi:hypothetical protein MIND_01253700 [Mycena indigotica]|uniref:Uncharacterized protein n=1 Tax=Mycena indigotica TaxID=2126181 RepID=A0A8H6VT80_9AGAR|nr:uncharacterized protein MIND_01253700 [Mycena indigotica]KAF7291106.1 hypothetical protein MIND_01253700 [Mycena indigotica]